MRLPSSSSHDRLGSALTPVDEDRPATMARHESRDNSSPSAPVAIKLYGYDCDKAPNVRLFIKGKPDLGKEIVNVSANGGREWQMWRPPLHWAAILGSAECAKLFLEAGADALQVDREGNTPLKWARLGNADKDLISLLVSAEQGLPYPGLSTSPKVATSPKAL